MDEPRYARLALEKIGTGGLIVSNANTFRGGLTLASASQVQLNSVGAAGTGPMVFAATDAELNYSGGGAITWTNDITVNNGVRGILSADDGNTLEVAGVISGAGSLWRPNNFSEQGTLILSGANTFGGGFTLAGGTLILKHPRATGRGAFSIGDPLFFNGSSLNVQAGVNLSGGEALTNAVVLNRFVTFGGTNALELAGPVTLAFTSPQVSINVDTPASVVISGPLGGAGFGINKTGDGLLTLNSVATFDGRLGISTGPLAIGPAGAVPNAADILVGGSGLLDVASAPGFTVGVGQELRGAGTVLGDITVAGELIPNGSIFTFTFSNNLTLTASSTTTMNINRNASPAPEQVACHGSLQFGGVLVVNNFGPPLQLGDTFDLFGFSGNPGNFASFTLPPLDAGLAWNTSNLGVNGTISVVSTGPTPPQLANPQLATPTSFIMTVNGGTANGQFRVLTHTNVDAPALHWEVLSTNTYDASGNLTVTNLVNPAESMRFFRTVEP